MIFYTPRRTAGPFSLALAVIVALGTVTFGGYGRALAFPEETETQGEIPGNLNGIWLVVHHLKFDRPTPQATPGVPQVPTTRIFNVVNLFKITHLEKEKAQKVRDARARKLQASIAKAKAIVAEEASGKIPMQNAEGEIEGGARVVVPQIPRPPGYNPVIHQGDKVEIFLLDVNMPKTVDDAYQAAQKAERLYEPTDKELALLGSSWQSLELKKDTEYSRIEWKVIAPNFYNQSLQIDPTLKDTKFTITGTQAMIPRPGQPNQNIVVYGVRETSDTTLVGKHSRAMMATAPFPVPIEMDGTFKMFKVADLPGAKSPAAPADKKKEEKPAS